MALLNTAEAMKSQAEATMALAMAQIAAAQALLGAEPPTPMAHLTAQSLTGVSSTQNGPPRHYGSIGRARLTEQPSQE
jgi:hypothetical protein